jgi:hypothetical protein
VAYIEPADIAARVPETTYLQLFDKDNDGVVTLTAGHVDRLSLDAAINASQSVIDTELEVPFPEGLTANGGTVDERIKGAQVAITLFECVRYGPLSTGREGSTFREGYDDAIRLLARLRKTDGVKLKTGNGGDPPATRVGSVQNGESVLGVPTNTYARTADGRDPSAF